MLRSSLRVQRKQKMLRLKNKETTILYFIFYHVKNLLYNFHTLKLVMIYFKINIIYFKTYDLLYVELVMIIFYT